MSRTAFREAVSRKVLVVGLGNSERADDGVGVEAARQLAGRLPEDVTLLVGGRDVLSLVDDWAGFDALVCIDAAAPMGNPGRIHRIDLATAELPREMSLVSSHAFGLVEAVRLARTLQRAPQAIIVYAIEGDRFDLGAPMTAAAAAAVDGVIQCVTIEVDRLRQSITEGPITGSDGEFAN
jgi:hydrogenase maturation protease